MQALSRPAWARERNEKRFAAGREALRLYFPVVPFFIFAIAFLIAPAAVILAGAFLSRGGDFTFANFVRLGAPKIRSAYRVTIELSASTAAIGCAAGFLIAWQLENGRLPPWCKKAAVSFSGVASNFAGVPLAFAFIATLGRTGIVTRFLQSAFSRDLYDSGFSLYSFRGLVLAYLYFQIPLMIMVILPAIESVKKEWREAAKSLGVSSLDYWFGVLLPILAPPIAASFLLLFGNAFGAYATAYALTGGMLNLVTIVIGSQIRGDVLHDPNLGYALAAGMVFIMAATSFLSISLSRRFSRWTQ